MPNPDGSPMRTPIPTEAPSISPEREYEADPARLCPEQKERLTREIGPKLPD